MATSHHHPNLQNLNLDLSLNGSEFPFGLHLGVPWSFVGTPFGVYGVLLDPALNIPGIFNGRWIPIGCSLDSP